MRIRPIRENDEGELSLVAQRMRLTLMEVVGQETGEAMYTPEWLVARVRWHLNPDECTGAVFVAEHDGDVVGHTIVRVDADDEGRPMGLFSTTYVAEEARRLGVADALLERGEAWMLEHGMTFVATHTSATNEPLIRLYEKHGYAIVLKSAEDEMIRLGKVCG